MQTKNGPVLIELGARLHGGIAPQLFEECYNPGLLQSYINLLTNNFTTTTSILKKQARIVFLINTNPVFMVDNMSILEREMKNIIGVMQIKLFFNESELVPLTKDLSTCPCIVSIQAENTQELDEIEIQVRSLFKAASSH